jgi:3-methyladenine DNA glycosylase Tag
MNTKIMERKAFLKVAGKIGGVTCLCAAAGSLRAALYQEKPQAQPGEKTKERAVKRMKYADQWVKRFFDVIDKTLDEKTRKRLMMANGRACYREWIRDTNQEIKQVDFKKWAERASQNIKQEGFKIEGNVIYFQFNSSAETGRPSPENVCLCPMVESKPEGLSSTFCHCSVGYVKEMNELKFGRIVDVELIDSVLKGGKRCKFKITVLNLS